MLSVTNQAFPGNSYSNKKGGPKNRRETDGHTKFKDKIASHLGKGIMDLGLGTSFPGDTLIQQVTLLTCEESLLLLL